MDNPDSPEWNDWRWQLERFREAARSGGVGIAATPYYASLMSERAGSDPIRRQLAAAPSADSAFESDDPLGEEAQSPLPRLVHRYADRVLLLATNRCAVRCSFCLRGRIWRGTRGSESSAETAGWEVSDAELDEVERYLTGNPEVREVLVSGGDPLVLETPRLSRILTRLSRIPSIKIIRVGSRVPVVMPMRVDAELAEMLASIPGLWLATHFNHPVEITDAALSACRALVSRGVPVLNQTVLLKGVNDTADTLAELFSTLAANRIKPHYLFHVDPARGCSEFATGVERGLELLRTLRNRLSSVSTPTFAIDLPGGGGKVPLLPDYAKDKGAFEGLDGSAVTYPFSASCFKA
jgi:lysine 2,3-aminomutase